jgi:anti-sigma B factor antagonist
MSDHLTTRSPAPPLVLAVERHAAATVLAISGEIDTLTADRVRARACELLDEMPSALVIDVSEVDYFGSSGTNVLVVVAKCARERAVGFSVVTCPAVLRVLRITNADEGLVLFTSRAEALGIAVPVPRTGAQWAEDRTSGRAELPSSRSFQVRCGFRTDAVVVTVTGEVDVDTIPDLERRVVAALKAATAPTTTTFVVVDLTGVLHLDSCGLNMLLRCDDLGRRLGVPLRLVASTRRVLRPIVATELDSVLVVYPQLADALAPVN